MNRRTLVALGSIFIHTTLFAQDSISAKSIEDITRKKYDLQNKTYWILTREKILPEAECGTEVSVSLINDSIYRIVCTGSNKEGKWAKEYYPLDGQLAFCYGSDDFYEGDGYKNWKGYPAAEFRVYYKAGKLVHQKRDGIHNKIEFSSMVTTLPAEYIRVLRWVRKKLPAVTLK